MERLTRPNTQEAFENPTLVDHFVEEYLKVLMEVLVQEYIYFMFLTIVKQYFDKFLVTFSAVLTVVYLLY